MAYVDRPWFRQAVNDVARFRPLPKGLGPTSDVGVYHVSVGAARAAAAAVVCQAPRSFMSSVCLWVPGWAGKLLQTGLCSSVCEYDGHMSRLPSPVSMPHRERPTTRTALQLGVRATYTYDGRCSGLLILEGVRCTAYNAGTAAEEGGQRVSRGPLFSSVHVCASLPRASLASWREIWQGSGWLAYCCSSTPLNVIPLDPAAAAASCRTCCFAA